MFYTDKIHLIAGDNTTIEELHSFAQSVGLSRCYFHGVRKGHPHYDLTNSLVRLKVLTKGVKVVDSRIIMTILREKWTRKKKSESIVTNTKVQKTAT